MNLPPIRGVAITGKAASGKTRLAQAICSLREGSCILPFADPLKAEVRELYGLEKTDPGGREKLIEHGEAKRAEDPEYWIRKLQDRVLSTRGFVVVDDLRMLTELDWAERLGFYIVRVDAPYSARHARLLARGDTDLSVLTSRSVTECELDGQDERFDYRFLNALGTDIYREAVMILYGELSRRHERLLGRLAAA